MSSDQRLEAKIDKIVEQRLKKFNDSTLKQLEVAARDASSEQASKMDAAVKAMADDQVKKADAEAKVKAGDSAELKRHHDQVEKFLEAQNRIVAELVDALKAALGKKLL